MCGARRLQRFFGFIITAAGRRSEGERGGLALRRSDEWADRRRTATPASTRRRGASDRLPARLSTPRSHELPTLARVNGRQADVSARRRHLDALMCEARSTVDNSPIRRHCSLLRQRSADESGADAASRFSDVAAPVDRPISRVHLLGDGGHDGAQLVVSVPARDTGLAPRSHGV